MQELRELVAGIIISDPDKYSSAMLGRSNDQYAEWIMKDQSWGGTYVLHCVVTHTCLRGVVEPLGCYIMYKSLSRKSYKD